MTRIVLFFSFLIFTFSLQAIEKMDLNTTNLVIQKLEKSLQGLKLEEIKNEALLSRLGDLYSEKARLLFLQEEEQRCESSCEGSQKARLKAIRFYQKVLKGRDHVLKTRAMFQMAYLYQVTGQSLKAKSVYHNILKSRKYSKGLKAQAHVALGDVYFQEKNYKKALEHFNQALQFPGLLKKGDVLHKKAWALFFLGKTQKAQQLLVHLLKRMDVVGLAQGHQLDQAFYEEVLRDLTTFLAKTPITSQKIKLLLSLTPDRLQKSTLFFLAQESERLGQRRSALLIWNQYQSYFQLKTDEKAFVDFRKARLYYEFNQYALSLKFFKKALASLKKSSCRSDECALLKGQIKDYVILWNKEFRTRPNTLLLQVNQTYLKTFPDDFSILLQSAKIAQTLKSWKKAITLYRQISEKTNDKKILSLSLWGEIECAENSGDYELRKQAYQHFLEVQPKDPRAYEVRYQMAHLSFEKKDYKKAYLQFLKLALASSQERKQNKKLSVLAADLTVLSLQFLKDDSTLEDVSQRLAAYYPKKRKSFLKIATEAKVRQAVQVNNKKKKAKPEELLEAYKKIVRPFGLSSKKQMKVAFLRLSLAEKAHQLTLVEKESRQLLKRELNAKDKHFVQERLLWALELQLKFKAAYALAKNMRFPYLSLEDRELRLALLSELAGQNPQKHYQNIFRKGRSLLKRNLALVEIIRRSRRPWPLLEKYQKKLRKTPQLFGEIILETYGKYKNKKRALAFLKERRVRASDKGRLLQQVLLAEDLQSLHSKVRKAKLFTQSAYLLRKSLRKKLGLLSQMEEFANKAIFQKDLLLQAASLDLLGEEYMKLYDQLVEIPAPRSLSASQRKVYRKKYLQEIAIYKKKAAAFDRKAMALWDKDSEIQAYLNLIKALNPVSRRAFVREFQFFATIAPRGVKRLFKNTLNDLRKKPRLEEVQKAWALLRKQPFELDYIKRAKALEQARGEETKVAYLNMRMLLVKPHQGGRR